MLLPACLEVFPVGRRWQLHRGIVTMGRDPACNISLDSPEIKERRLISAQHAYIQCEDQRYTLHDGSPSGRASTNGTYLNSKPVPPGGLPLKDGDLILLAAVNPAEPRMDTPGVATLRFRESCQP
jgi:pSer/pThr/pTyr-binding forkhead associated (FHA) protein